MRKLLFGALCLLPPIFPGRPATAGSNGRPSPAAADCEQRLQTTTEDQTKLKRVTEQLTAELRRVNQVARDQAARIKTLEEENARLRH